MIEVDTSVLVTKYAEAYFTERADRRIMIGLRATLEMLNIPLPEWAERKPTGRKPGRALRAKHIMAAYDVDNRSYEPLVLAPRKPNATPERMAEIEAEKATRPLADRIAALKAAQPDYRACDQGNDPLAE